jgi:hypothetical protein
MDGGGWATNAFIYIIKKIIFLVHCATVSRDFANVIINNANQY